MQKLTKTEIQWIIQELEQNAAHYLKLCELSQCTALETELFTLKAEQLRSISQRLTKTAEKNERRIEVIA